MARDTVLEPRDVGCGARGPSATSCRSGHCACAQGPRRRDVLIAASGAAIGVALAAVGCGSETGSGPDGPVEGMLAAGQLADYPIGTVRRVDEGPVFVLRDAAGLYAMSAVCTHLGCTLDVEADRLPCSCHGSEFAFDGSVLNGPANDPLRHYAVHVAADGSVTVDTTQVVGAGERAAV